MLLALVLAQALSLPNPRGPIFNQPSLMGAQADFEAFPASGRGAGLAAPYPNWFLQSDSIDNASWWKLNGGAGSVPTVTANYEGTADRVQFSACPAITDTSYLQQQVSRNGSASIALDLKGTSGSGTVRLRAYSADSAVSAWQTCAFTASAYTECSLYRTVTAAEVNGFYIMVGCMNDTGSNDTGAADVLIKTADYNLEASARQPHIVTTTAAFGYTPTGSRGEALTFARSTVAYSTAGTDGLRLTAIADGDLVLQPVNQPRMMKDADGVVALLVEGAMTPVTIQARPLCNAAWANVGTPGCAANSTTGPFGSTTMALITDDDGAVHEGRSQTMATTSLTRHTFSCYLKAGTSTTAELSFTGTGNSAGDFGVSVSGLSTTTSTRVVVTSPVAYAAGLTAVTAKVLVGTNAAGTGTIYAEGCNHVPNATYQTSFMDAAAVAVARTAETATFAKSVVTTNGVCTAANVQVPVTTAFQTGSGMFAPGLSANAGSFGSPYLWPYTGGAGTSLSIDGAGSSGAPTGYVPAINASLSARYIASHNGTAWRICKNGTCSVNAAPSAWSSPTYAHIKLSAPTYSDSLWSRIQVDNDWSNCR